MSTLKQNTPSDFSDGASSPLAVLMKVELRPWLLQPEDA